MYTNTGKPVLHFSSTNTRAFSRIVLKFPCFGPRKCLSH